MPRTLAPDWFLPEWMATKSINQAQLAGLTGWGKSKTSELVNGKRSYTRTLLNEAAAALLIQPFEMLMRPEDAMRLLRLRETALTIAADTATEFRHAEPVRKAG